MMIDMRGSSKNQDQLFYSFSVEDRIPKKHPLRALKKYVDQILLNLDGDFAKLYSGTGRPSTPPEFILRALFLQTLFTIRSEAQLIEQLEYNFLYRWFVGLSVEDKVWDETVFSKNRQRLIDGTIADKFFSEVLLIAGREKLISKEHFSVDGTLIEAWASLKSFQKKEDEKKSKDDKDPDDRNPNVDFKGEKRSNQTHESTTDPESKIYTKSPGVAAKLSFMGHVVMENRNGLAVNYHLNQPSWASEHEAAIEMMQSLSSNQNKTVGGDKHYDQKNFVESMRDINVSAHVAQNIHSRRPKSAIDERTTRHAGYGVSQVKRKRIEEIFGWLKNIGLMRRPHFRGIEKMTWQFSWAVAIYNLVRIRNLCAN
jgi:transposase